MKKIITMILLCAYITTLCCAMADSSFDMSVFVNQKGNIRPDEKMWLINLDDMEARGFIYLNVTGEWEVSGDWDWISLGISPDIFLMNYGTSDFVPLPRIWLYYKDDNWLFANTAIFKIGDKTYTFNDISVDRYVNSTKNKYDSGITEKLVCICRDTEFMDAWIENTAPIKVRVKGDKGNNDFMIPEDTRANISVMFENFRDAGGYSYFS